MAIYNSAKVKLGDGSIDWDTDTIKFALVKSSYTPDIDAHDFWDDVVGAEVSNSGSYSAGGATLTTSVTQDNTNDRAIYDASDFTFTSFTGTFRYGVFYKDTGNSGTSPVIGYIDFTGADIVAVSATVSINVSSAGIFNLS